MNTPAFTIRLGGQRATTQVSNAYSFPTFNFRLTQLTTVSQGDRHLRFEVGPHGAQ